MFTMHRSPVTKLCSKAHKLDWNVTQYAEHWVVWFSLCKYSFKNCFLFWCLLKCGNQHRKKKRMTWATWGVWRLGLHSHRCCSLLTVLCSRWGLCTETLINYQAQNNPQAWHLITKSIWISWLTPEVSVFIETGLSESPLALTELRPFFCLHIKNLLLLRNKTKTKTKSKKNLT